MLQKKSPNLDFLKTKWFSQHLFPWNIKIIAYNLFIFQETLTFKNIFIGLSIVFFVNFIEFSIFFIFFFAVSPYNFDFYQLIFFKCDPMKLWLGTNGLIIFFLNWMVFHIRSSWNILWAQKCYATILWKCWSSFKNALKILKTTFQIYLLS